jgi:hypothetical protein
LLIASPSVRRPSLIAMLNGTSRCTALLYSRMVSSAFSAFTPSIFWHSSSSVFARTLVTCLMRYSSRNIGISFWSKTCHANMPG